MRVNLRLLGGKLLLVGDLVGSALELQQAIVRGELTFDLARETVPAVAGEPTFFAGDPKTLETCIARQADRVPPSLPPKGRRR